MGEIEAQMPWINERAPLLHMISKGLPERPLQEMSGGMIRHRGTAQISLNGQFNSVPHLEDSALNNTDVYDQFRNRPCGVFHFNETSVRGDDSPVSYLSA
jgi:hypothetical protein